MKTRDKQGFTLIEMMIVIAILAIFMAFVFTNILNTRRISANEDVRLDLDRVGNQVLRTLSLYAKDAVLPVRQRPLGKGSPVAQLLANDVRGFGSNAEDWEKRLVDGSNFLAFCIPIDADGSGDCLDGEMLPYLGISHPRAFSFQDAASRNKSKNQITDAAYDGNYKRAAAASVNPGLAGLTPDEVDPLEEDVNIPDGAYALIRFVPLLKKDGNPVTVHEGVDTGGAARGLHCDIDGDGRFNSAMQYYIGNIVVEYPKVSWTDLESGKKDTYDAISTRLGTMDRVAIPVQTVRGQPNWAAPLFTLIALQDDGGLVEVKPGDVSQGADADDLVFDSLRISLTLVNYRDRDSIRQGDPDHPGTGGDIMQNKYWQTGTVGQLNNVMAKRYEAVIRLRNL